jgi:PsbP-like protein
VFKNKTVQILTILIISLTILAVACSPTTPAKPATPPPSSTSIPSSAQKPATPKSVTYTNDQYGFSITYPGDWEVVSWPNTIFYARAKMTVPVISLVTYDTGKSVERANEVIAADKGKNIKFGNPVDFTAADGKTKGQLYLIDWDYPTSPLTTLLLAIDGKNIYAAYTNVASWYKEVDAKAVISTLTFK